MDINTYIAESKKLVNGYLDKLLPLETAEPSTIHKAMRYSVFAGGKRVRPILVLASGESLSGDRTVLLTLGAGIEMMHTYSLIHDDLPALDNDDLRRGYPTCHKVFGDAIAILAGDALMTRCYQVLADVHELSDSVRISIIREIAAATGTIDGMIGGQVVDLESEGKPVEAGVLEYIHHSKTGALLGACVRCGALAAGAQASELHALTEFGKKIGLVFQTLDSGMLTFDPNTTIKNIELIIVDDILDVTSSSEVLGKTAGKDAKVKKATYPALYGIEASRQYAQELMTSALEDIHDLGDEANTLRGLARFIVSRTA